jgi:hypothetical protein
VSTYSTWQQNEHVRFFDVLYYRFWEGTTATLTNIHHPGVIGFDVGRQAECVTELDSQDARCVGFISKETSSVDGLLQPSAHSLVPTV